MLRDLLTTWETWSARDTLARAVGRAPTRQARERLTRSLDDMPEVAPLDALRAATELIDLLQSWQWQAVYAARLSGASWNAIGGATGVAAEEARVEYLTNVERQEQQGFQDTSKYRAAR